MSTRASKPVGIVKNAKEVARKKKTMSQKQKTTAVQSTTEPAIELDESTTPVYFWREYNHNDGYLSQWYLSPFSDPEEPEIVYQTAEQYMMYQKAVLFKDPATGAKILKNSSPKDQKALGRQVQNFNDGTWNDRREKIVEQGNYLKFRFGAAAGALPGEREKKETLREMLERTGEREIVEASPRDRIWGIGFGEKSAEERREKWGLNLLGKSLMRVRERLRDEEQEMATTSKDAEE